MPFEACRCRRLGNSAEPPWLEVHTAALVCQTNAKRAYFGFEEHLGLPLCAWHCPLGDIPDGFKTADGLKTTNKALNDLQLNYNRGNTARIQHVKELSS